ncbi:MAG TPA: hypothetical protein VFK54_03200 [Candidatus Limnocylindrales bacterium]|nr:hypothetical protein [Candidatus Limnocylindrales bacterium]
MATQALPSGRPVTRRRAFFGLFDADGWGWASAKALFWFVVSIFLIGYIPDRAYYFTVERTLDLGVLAWSPINLCPPENEGLPCPPEPGSTLPWHPAPQELALPAARADGGAVQVGTNVLYIGGSDGSTASADVFVAPTVGSGNFDRWAPGPALPEPRANAAVTFFGGSVYVIGGEDADGAPTTTVYALTPSAEGGLGEWTEVEDLALPEARAGAAVVAAGDGLIVAGGANADGPTNTVWKALLATNGELEPWVAQAPLFEAVTEASMALVGDYLWLMGGEGANGPVATVQVGTIGHPGAAEGDGGHGGAAEGTSGQGATDGSGQATETDAGAVTSWRVSEQTNLPGPRADAAGWTANGVLYLVGGTDGSQVRPEQYWTVPTPDGSHPGWKHLDGTDLGEGIAGSAPLVSGSNAFAIGGETASGVTTGSARTNLAPQEPFFQLGILGATVPALKIEGEIGQQLGYLNAMGVGMLNFAILVAIGVAFAHRERTLALWRRLRRR